MHWYKYSLPLFWMYLPKKIFKWNSDNNYFYFIAEVFLKLSIPKLQQVKVLSRNTLEKISFGVG